MGSLCQKHQTEHLFKCFLVLNCKHFEVPLCFDGTFSRYLNDDSATKKILIFHPVFGLFCHLESHFYVIYEESAHVDPCTSGYSLKRMLNETSVSCLVVAGMEAVLEDGHLDVVSFFCVLPRELTLSVA